MATTARGIYYPDNAGAITPIEGIFAQMATTTDTAITAASVATYGRARLSSDQAIDGSGTKVQVAFSTLLNGANVTSSGSGLRAGLPGLYLVQSAISVLPNASNTWRNMEYRVNGTVVPYASFAGVMGPSGKEITVSGLLPIVLAANDLVTVWTAGSQDGTIRMNASTFSLVRVGT